jgi:hypothetical protein
MMIGTNLRELEGERIRLSEAEASECLLGPSPKPISLVNMTEVVDRILPPVWPEEVIEGAWGRSLDNALLVQLLAFAEICEFWVRYCESDWLDLAYMRSVSSCTRGDP